MVQLSYSATLADEECLVRQTRGVTAAINHCQVQPTTTEARVEEEEEGEGEEQAIGEEQTIRFRLNIVHAVHMYTH